jgi:hypothetical protein
MFSFKNRFVTNKRSVRAYSNDMNNDYNHYYDMYNDAYRRKLACINTPRHVSCKEFKDGLNSVWKDMSSVSLNIENGSLCMRIDCCQVHVVDSFQLDTSIYEALKDLNSWNMTMYTLECIREMTDGADVNPSQSINISLGIPVSRLIEFYGIRK